MAGTKQMCKVQISYGKFVVVAVVVVVGGGGGGGGGFLTNALINTLLIIPIFVLMLYSTPKPNLKTEASIVWPVK